MKIDEPVRQHMFCLLLRPLISNQAESQSLYPSPELQKKNLFFFFSLTDSRSVLVVRCKSSENWRSPNCGQTLKSEVPGGEDRIPSATVYCNVSWELSTCSPSREPAQRIAMKNRQFTLRQTSLWFIDHTRVVTDIRHRNVRSKNVSPCPAMVPIFFGLYSARMSRGRRCVLHLSELILRTPLLHFFQKAWRQIESLLKRVRLFPPAPGS